MKTLAYFASGSDREEYQDLGFDRIYLIDNCFRRRGGNEFSNGKVKCIGMDCLEAIDYLRTEGTKIDCFVCLNEGLFEGGGHYALNSDMFLGYAMPLFQDKYIHIMNKHYYQHHYKVSMDLPYDMEEITETDNRFIDPFTFVISAYHKGHAKVYQMTKSHSSQTITLDSFISLSIVHDSIWNYYDELDCLVISIAEQGQQSGFFDRLPKVVNVNNKSIDDILSDCVQHKINKIGFTPWKRGRYISFIDRLEQYNEEYPKEIVLFHLNKNDYREILGSTKPSQ